MDYFCKKCGELDSRGALSHRCAINSDAINKPIAINTKIPALVVSREEKAPVVVSSGLRSANRRSKEDYNEYMRSYMRKKRACLKS